MAGINNVSCFRLHTVEPQDPMDDLELFLAVAASRSVIGLGEATHGTQESFQLKHRLIRLLAEHGGLRTVAFECGLAPGRLIDQFVRFGQGSAREVLAQQRYWCWENEEVLALIEWLREHNSGLPADERIAFVGVDVQRVESGLPELLAALEGSTRDQDSAGSESRSTVLSEAAQTVRWLMDGELDAGSPQAGQAVRHLFGAAEWLGTPELRALCRNVARYVDVYLNPEHEDGLVKRDEYMAATVLEVLKERPGLMVVWAHNEHAAVNPEYFGTRAMGHHLRSALGDGYLSLGMLFGEGAFLARSWEERVKSRIVRFSIGRAGLGHVERFFDDLPLGLYATAALPTNAEARYRRMLGSLYDHEIEAHTPEAFRIERPITDFDVVAWLPETAAAQYIGAEPAPRLVPS